MGGCRRAAVALLVPRLAAAARDRDELGLSLELRRRSVSSYTPRPDGSRAAGATGEPPGRDWAAFEELTGRVARAVFPTLTEPLFSRAELRARVGDDAAWEALFERPLGRAARALLRGRPRARDRRYRRADRHLRRARRRALRQNRCFLYHVIGSGTGDWDVPVGGMGTLTEELAPIAWAAGAELRAEREVTAIETDGVGAEVRFDGRSVPRPPRAGRRRTRRARAAARASRARGSRRPRAPSSSSTCC